MPLTILAGLARDLDEGRRSPGNLQQALDAYQEYLGREATATVSLVIPEDYPEGEETLSQVQQVFEWFWEASEILRNYSSSRSLPARQQALSLASQADSLLRDLIWLTYDRATRKFYAG